MMASEKVQFKQRSPISQLLLSLFIPFYYLYWLASSHKQINQLAGQGEKGTPPIRMSVWWPIGLLIVGVALVVGAIAVAIAGDVDTDNYAASPLPAASASIVVHPEDDLLPTNVGYHSGVADHDASPSAGYPDDIEGSNDNAPAAIGFFVLYFLGIAVFISFQIVHFFYLLQHTDGLIRLAGSDRDKTYLIVMSAIGCFVFQGLLLAVVHKSQTIVNQAIGESG